MAYSAEIIAKLGMDATGFQQSLVKSDASLTVFEQRLSKFGVNFNPGAKFARESARVFEEVATAEAKLAAVQADRTLRVGAGHKQEVILQREILTLKQAIDRIEGQTVAKVEAQILLSQKQLQLEQAIAAQRVKSASAGSAGAGVGSFAREAAAAEARAGGLSGAMGKLVSVTGVLKGAFTSLIGVGSALFAPAIADKAARWITGFSEANEKALDKMVEDTGKAADAAEARLAEARARDAEDRQRVDEANMRSAQVLADFRYQTFMEGLEAERRAREEATEAERESLDMKEDMIRENLELLVLEAKSSKGLSEEEAKRLKVLRDQLTEYHRQQDIIELLKNSNRNPEEEQILQTLIKQSAEYKKHVELVGEVAKKVKEASAEQIRQLEIQREQDQLAGKGKMAAEDRLIAGGRAFGPSRDPKEFDRASSNELMELIRRLQSDIQFVEQTKGTGLTALADAATGYFVQGSIIARLKTDIQRATFELNQRNGITADFVRGGEDRARKNFAGDPLQFDEFLSRQGKQIDEQTALLRDIKAMFQSGKARVGAINLN